MPLHLVMTKNIAMDLPLESQRSQAWWNDEKFG